VVALLAVAEPATRLASVVLSAANPPPDEMLHWRSAAGLFVLAGAVGDVLVAVHSAEEARM